MTELDEEQYEGWDWQQRLQARLVRMEGYSISDPSKDTYLNPSEWDWLQMDEERLARGAGVSINDLDPLKHTWGQMEEIRLKRAAEKEECKVKSLNNKESKMLVLTRKEGESIFINDDIRVKVLRTSSGGVRLGIEAPSDVIVHREEVRQRIKDGNCQS